MNTLTHKLPQHGPCVGVALAIVLGWSTPASSQPTASSPPQKRAAGPAYEQAVDQVHAGLFAEDQFPSAKQCAECHPNHFREWSVSPHAYGQLSPVFNAMSSKLVAGTNGTLGDFCVRCHTQVGMALGEPIGASNLDRHPASREGVTCSVCHRINQAWGKMSSRQALVPGDINTPNYGPTGNKILAEVLANPDKYGAFKKAKEEEVLGRPVHVEMIRFFQLETSAFCGACHDVFAPNGFRLEDLFSEFKVSPAAREKGQKCHDCHMGKVPGVASDYDFAPAAKVGNVSTPPRKRTNHMFVGPDYSIVHPGLFPHHLRAIREENARPGEGGLATMRQWLQFDHTAGWGTEEFEDDIAEDYVFPAAWADPARRFAAREILNEQFELLAEATAARRQLLSTGYRLGNTVTDQADRGRIRFRVPVSNGTDGHGVPTGFDAERIVFLRVSVADRDGSVVFKSGDLDPNGDLRDEHSSYVHNGEVPRDRFLFNLQTRFIVRNVRGPESDLILNVPYSLDPLPFMRPETRPFTVLGRPMGARKHKQNLEVGGTRWAPYEVQRRQLTGRGPYRATVQLIAGMVPVNLVHEISSVGFDYGMSPRDVANGVLAGHLVLHEQTVLFDVP